MYEEQTTALNEWGICNFLTVVCFINREGLAAERYEKLHPSVVGCFDMHDTELLAGYRSLNEGRCC